MRRSHFRVVYPLPGMGIGRVTSSTCRSFVKAKTRVLLARSGENALLDKLQVDANSHAVYKYGALINELLRRDLIIDERAKRIDRANIVDHL